jgi:hypothetical protein
LEGLVLILDSLTYVEELIHLPDGMRPTRPTFLPATANCYYVYNFSDGSELMSRAGPTLENVYTGMNDFRYEDCHENVRPDEGWVGGADYLLIYRKGSGSFGRTWSDENFLNIC